MKKVVYILAVVVVVAVCSLVGVAVYLVTTTEDEKNKRKTEAARNARWPKDPEQPEPEIKTENVIS